MNKSNQMKKNNMLNKSDKKSISNKKTTIDDNSIKNDTITNQSIAEINDLKISEIFRLMDLHFNRKNYIFRHLYDSYNKFIEEDVRNFLEYGDHVFTENMTNTTYFRHRFKYENICIQTPMLENGIEPMFPSDARYGNLTYSLKILADVTQLQDIVDISTNLTKTNNIGETEKQIVVNIIPIMLRSKFCNLSINKDVNKNECKFDAGGYFIVNGSEKVVIAQDRMVENKPLVFVKKDSGVMSLVVQVNSKSYKSTGLSQVVSIKIKKDGNMIIRVPILQEINVFILLRALGLESDRDIIDYTVYDESDIDMVDLARISLNSCVNEKGIKIQSKQEAYDFLINKLRILGKYTDTDKEIKAQQKKMHLIHLLQNSLLPHVEGDLIKKAHYIGYMIYKLFRVHLNRNNIDDRDSCVNKRMDLPGDSMFELYKPAMKKVYGECKKFFDTRNKDNNKPINVINYIKPNIVEQQLKSSLSTGQWLRRQGVAQPLQRITYLQTISFLRRVDAPSGDASVSKLTGPRHLHPSSVGFLCCSQTPEHAKIGLTKHLTMIGSITIMSKDQYVLLKNYIVDKVQDITSVPYYKLRSNDIYKVFLNGDWLGITSKYIELYNDMNSMKSSGHFDRKNVSIVIDHEEFEIKIYCESGRLYRPVLKIKDNEIILKKKHIEIISLNRIDKSSKITDWEEFLSKYPDVIEYIDMELQPYVFIASKIKEVENMRQLMVNSIELSKNVKSNHTSNRYGEMTYVKYTHCEIHPSLLVGEITTNVPFFNYNAGARSIFQYSQSRQAMGLYATNYRHRTNDISFILYNVQKPLVTSRPAVYTNSELMPAGENAIVAIATYTGYNQEDSLIFNRSSIERGKFRAISLKKYISSVQKNQSTSQDDIFAKPSDPSKVFGMKPGSYDKLNDQGYVPEETTIINGDIIMAKLTPISDMNLSGKQFKDSSEMYKMHSPGVVDRVYVGIQNPDGFEIRKMVVKSERTPLIGDKYCCYDDQTEILTDQGWIFFKDLTKTHKVASLIDGKTLYYQEPEEIQSYDFDGDMYRVDSNQVDLLVTPNHRMLIKTRSAKGYHVELAENLLGKTVQYKKNADEYDNSNMKSKYIVYEEIKPEIEKVINDEIVVNEIDKVIVNKPIKKIKKQIEKNNNIVDIKDDKDIIKKSVKKIVQKVIKDDIDDEIDPECETDEQIDDNIVNNKDSYYFLLPRYNERPEMKIPLNAWLRFFGIWIAEGHSSEQQVVIDAHKERVKTSLRKIIPLMGFKHCENYDKSTELQKNRFRINNVQLAEFMSQYSVGAINKSLPEWTWSLNMKQCKILLSGMVLGDGSTIKKGCSSQRYDTSSKKLANDFQRLCLHSGWATNISVRNEKGKTTLIKSGPNQGQTITTNEDGNRMTVIKTQLEPKVNKYKTQGKQQDSLVPYKGKVYCCTLPKTKGSIEDLKGIIYVRRNKITSWSGNSRHGQKGTIGILLPGRDMPYTAQGIVPDIILNPNAIPSRMTIGQLCECLVGKTAAIDGTDADGTAFEDYDFKEVRKRLLGFGYRDDGTEWLYNGMTGERMRTRIFIGPTYYQRLKHLVEDKIHCLTLDHEVLTSCGWKKYNEITKESLVACLKDNKLVYEKPTEILYYPNYKGTMYHIKSPQLDLMVTMNHRMWTSRFNGGDYAFELAENIIGKNRTYKKNAEWNVDTYDITEHHMLNNYLTNKEPIKLCDWVWLLNSDQCQTLLNHIFNHDQEYYTYSDIFSDDIMRLALHCGWSANKSLYCKSGKILEYNGRKIFARFDVWEIKIIKTENTPRVNYGCSTIPNGHFEEVIENFEGGVFCLAVPSEVFYVRRNGLPVWTANSRARGPRTLLTRQPPEGRSRDGGLRLGEMERDAIAAHGMAKFMKEKLLDNSDAYATFVCDTCGLFAQRFNKKENKSFSQPDDIYYCQSCNNYNAISKIVIPYAFKLLVHELMAMGIAPRIKTKKNIYTS
jgi:DNA-directed RNA polymerase II subunit RPB2